VRRRNELHLVPFAVMSAMLLSSAKLTWNTERVLLLAIHDTPAEASRGTSSGSAVMQRVGGPSGLG
jgi:hypothetical protein